MKNVNKLIGIMVIAIFAINLISCHDEEEKLNSPLKKYPKQILGTNIIPCVSVCRFEIMELDSLYFINDTVTYNKYYSHLPDCYIDFSKN